MEGSVTIKKVSIISTPVSNIDLENKSILDQGLMKEDIFTKDQTIKVYDRIDDKVESIKVADLKKKHWIYNSDRTFSKIIHVI